MKQAAVSLFIHVIPTHRITANTFSFTDENESCLSGFPLRRFLARPFSFRSRNNGDSPSDETIKVFSICCLRLARKTFGPSSHSPRAQTVRQLSPTHTPKLHTILPLLRYTLRHDSVMLPQRVWGVPQEKKKQNGKVILQATNRRLKEKKKPFQILTHFYAALFQPVCHGFAGFCRKEQVPKARQ